MPYQSSKANIRDVLFGENVQLVEPCNLYECAIGNNCFIGHGVMFINDDFKTGKPAFGNKDLWKQTLIGDHVSIGSNASILPVTICNNVVIGAGAVVTKNITEPGTYAGNPARKIR